MSLGELRAQSGIVALYHLGDVNDSSGNGFNLTNVNTVTFTTGKFGNAANYGASSGNKSLRIGSALGLTKAGAKTYIGWFKLASEIASGSWCLIHHVITAGGTGLVFQMFYEYNGGTRRLSLGTFGSTGVNMYYTKTLGTTWHQLGFLDDGTNLKFIIDGQILGTTTKDAQSAGISSTTFNFGNSESGTVSIAGLIDEFSVWNVAKSASWVRKQYAIGRFGEL